MRLAELMETNVKTAEPQESARDALERMRTSNVHHIVVLKGREVIGVASEHDLLRGGSVADAMTAAPVVGTPDMTVQKAANLLRGRSIGCLPIVSGGHLAGIVTVTDLLELLGKGGGKADRTSSIRNGRRFNVRSVRGVP